MKIKPYSVIFMLILICIISTGCGNKKQNSKKQITLNLKTPPIGLGNVPDLGETDAYNLFVKATKMFQEQYDKYDITFNITRYNYLDEEEQLVEKYGTEEAADLLFAGSWNIPRYVEKNWLVPLDDIIDNELRSDIDEKIWEQKTINGHVYTIPFHQLQNTLMVNRKMMEEAGLDDYITEEDTIAHWTTEEFNFILDKLKTSLEEQNKFAFMMYAANNQGDSHIMTLLRAYGGTLYDKEGYFAVNTPEGIRALEWIQEMNRAGITPKGAENMELLDCIGLFNNEQLAICIGNLTNLWDAWNSGVDVMLANFPSMDGKGYVSSNINGFCVFDNGDETKIEAAKDFIKFIYTQEELMYYSLGTMPVNYSVIEQYQDEIPLLHAYGDNTKNTIDVINNNLNWQEVRDVFYLKIRDLLLGVKTPSETAASIDEDCNSALKRGGTIKIVK